MSYWIKRSSVGLATFTLIKFYLQPTFTRKLKQEGSPLKNWRELLLKARK